MLFHKIKYYGFMMLRNSCTNNNYNLELSRSLIIIQNPVLCIICHIVQSTLEKKTQVLLKKGIGTIGLFAPVVERLNEAIHQINLHPMY